MMGGSSCREDTFYCACQSELCTEEKLCWHSFFHKHSPQIFRYLYSILEDYEDAQDCLQKTFIKLFVNIEQYDPTRPLLHYMIRIARNVAYNFRRNPIREIELEENSIPPKPNFEEFILHDLALEKAIDWVIKEAGLNQEQSTLLVYLVVEGLKPKEIASIIGTLPKQTRQKLWRLRKQIQTEINRQDLSDFFNDSVS